MAASESMLVFRVGTLWLAVPSQQVSALHPPQPPTPVPLAPPHVPGVANLRGEVVPLLALDRYFEGIAGEDETSVGFSRIAIVTGRGMRVGVLCDEVRGVMVPPGERHPVRATRDARLERVAECEIVDGDDLLIVLDVGRLLEETRARA